MRVGLVRGIQEGRAVGGHLRPQAEDGHANILLKKVVNIVAGLCPAQGKVRATIKRWGELQAQGIGQLFDPHGAIGKAPTEVGRGEGYGRSPRHVGCRLKDIPTSDRLSPNTIIVLNGPAQASCAMTSRARLTSRDATPLALASCLASTLFVRPPLGLLGIYPLLARLMDWEEPS